ncbi:MAG: glucoamylase family protein, partial [Bacteroidales bacterium]
RNKIISFVWMLMIGMGAAAQGLYVVPANIKAAGYAAHVELTWVNHPGFTYEIYAAPEGSNAFELRGTTTGSQYFDFVQNPYTPQKITYRIIPQGMNANTPEAAKFEVKAATQNYSDEELLNMVQQYTTRYFYDNAEPVSKMARERSNSWDGPIVTTGGTGFGIMALIAGAERGYFTDSMLIVYLQDIVRFLSRIERFHGAWAHWYNAETGAVFSFSQYDDGGDLVETAFLIQGLLTAKEWLLQQQNAAATQLASQIQTLWEEVEWNWYTQNGQETLYWHWSKNFGWKMNHPIRGFDETMITYVLAASSPTYPIKPEVYHKGYTDSKVFFNNKSYYGIKLPLGMEYGGPLFFTHYSFLGLNPNGLKDKYTNYLERNTAHAMIHYLYAIDNPKKHIGLSDKAWGFTSSDDPLVGYTSHHPGTNDENGTISPTAAISSIVYTPEQSLKAIRYFYYELGPILFNEYGFYDSFNLGMVSGQQVVHSYLAIDQGPIAVMIENYRSHLLWDLFMSNKEIQQGLTRLGFKYQKP